MPALDPADILDIAVYPPIGIARVGNAEGADDFILAAQVVGGVPPGDPRDGEGRLKRQAVRFHVYARMRAGGVRELTLDDGAAIEWRVAVANLKAGWYEFNNAMDLPDGQALSASRRILAKHRQRLRAVQLLVAEYLGRHGAEHARPVHREFITLEVAPGE